MPSSVDCRLTNGHQPIARRALFPGWLRSEPAAVGAAVVLTALVLFITSVAVPSIRFNGGLGDDGIHYADMARRFRVGGPGIAEVPYVNRVGIPFLVGLSGLSVRVGFLWVNAVALCASGGMLFVMLRGSGVSRGLAWLAVAWWATLPFGLRWALYYPVHIDGVTFAVVLGLLLCSLHDARLAFAALLALGATLGERPLIAVPFLFIVLMPHGLRSAARVTALAAAPGALVFVALRLFPPLAPASAGSFVDAPLAVLSQVIRNEHGFLVRFALAPALTLGLFAALPVAFAGRSLRFLRANPAWAYWLGATVLLSFVSESERVWLQATPALALLTCRAIGQTTSAGSRLAVGGLTIVHLAATRFLWPAGVDRGAYLDQMITWMNADRLVFLTLLTMPMLVLGAVLARVAFGHVRREPAFGEVRKVT